MVHYTKLNRKLDKVFGGKVCAMLDRDVLYLTGELYNWEDIVRAGHMSVDKKKYTVVNDIRFLGGEIPHMKIPRIASNSLEGQKPDVLIIGGGIIGCAIARELVRYKLNVMLVEKEHALALHASGRNDGIIHPGMILKKEQLMKKYYEAGSSMYPRICSELDVKYRFSGQYLCFAQKYLRIAVFAFAFYCRKFKGISVEYIGRKKLAKIEPHLSNKVKCALFFPNTGVVSPYDLTIAYAENAADNGAKIHLDTAVISMNAEYGNISSVLTNHGRVFPKLVINAAGVFSEDVARLANDRFYSIHPKCGVIHTIEGNLLVDPDTFETYEKEKISTNQESIKVIMEKLRNSIPEFSEQEIITNFSGIRAATYEEDFIISFGKFTKNIIHAAGIQLPGLTAAPAIAADVSKMAAEYLKAEYNFSYNPIRKAIVQTLDLSDLQRDALIKAEEKNLSK